MTSFLNYLVVSEFESTEFSTGPKGTQFWMNEYGSITLS